MHLVEQWLQEVFVLQDIDRGEANTFTQEAASCVTANKCLRGRETHCEFLDLSSKRRMKSHMLKKGGPEAHT